MLPVIKSLRSLFLVGILAAGVPVRSAAAGAAQFSVTAYGVVGDGRHLDTAAIQQAIDACAGSGGGVVVVPPGRYLMGTVRMRSDVTLEVESGAVLLGSQNRSDYTNDVPPAVEAAAFSPCLIWAENARNVVFRGAGTIDGQGTRAAFPGKLGAKPAERPMLIRLIGCEEISFAGLTFQNPASWGIHLVECRQVHFEGVSIQSRGNNSNNDGIDLDGCRDVTIEHCRINSNDDAICVKSTGAQPDSNIVVRHCDLSSATAGFKLGTSSSAGFKHIQVSDVRFHDCPMGVIKLLLVDGGVMDDIELARLTMTNVGGPIFIRLGDRGRSYDRPMNQVYRSDVQPEGRPVGSIRAVTIRQVKAEVTGDDAAYQGIMITGIPGHRIKNLVLEDVDVRFAGKAGAATIPRTVPEDIARYPEQYFFGILPSWGLFVRHVDGLTLKNVRIERTNADARKPFELQDVGAVRAPDFWVNGLRTPL